MGAQQYDVVIIGGGILGLAVLHKLLDRRPGLEVALLEKETKLAGHQTGNNSGVIHCGIYYKPGSLKAKLCVAGRRELVDFCREHDIQHEICGKLIVATRESELEPLAELERRAKENFDDPVRRVDLEGMREVEPHVSGIAGLHVSCTGIVDYPAMCETLGRLATDRGADIRLGCRFQSMHEDGDNMRLMTSEGEFSAGHVVNCAGLYSDKVARALGSDPGLKIVPFRGEYFELEPSAHHLVNGLIYPVPDPRFPFLGVHFTKMVKGGIEMGPNAVLAFRREGYRRRDIHLGELAETLTYPAFWKLAFKYWSEGAKEWYRSMMKSAFVRDAQRLIPALESQHVKRAGAGVRAQALDVSGGLIDDFRIVKTERTLNVLNAPSPAATASLAIGDEIVNELETLLPTSPAASA